MKARTNRSTCASFHFSHATVVIIPYSFCDFHRFVYYFVFPQCVSKNRARMPHEVITLTNVEQF